MTPFGAIVPPRHRIPNRLLTQEPAKSGLITLLRPYGWTEVTLPDATSFDRSQPGPSRTVATVAWRIRRSDRGRRPKSDAHGRVFRDGGFRFALSALRVAKRLRGTGAGCTANGVRPGRGTFSSQQWGAVAGRPMLALGASDFGLRPPSDLRVAKRLRLNLFLEHDPPGAGKSALQGTDHLLSGGSS